jgi:uncharacterized membrane protein YhhN
MIPGLVIVLAVAVVDWIAVAKGWTKVEKVAKPWTLAALLLLFLFSMLEWNSPNLLPMLFVAIGLAFCLAGDVFLLLSERWFIAGLVAFLLGHVCYILDSLDLFAGAATDHNVCAQPGESKTGMGYLDLRDGDQHHAALRPADTLQ